MSKVYVVLSESIINGHQSHGMHGVYANKHDAIMASVSAMQSLAQCGLHQFTGYQIDDSIEYEYFNGKNEVHVSCLLQEVK